MPKMQFRFMGVKMEAGTVRAKTGTTCARCSRYTIYVANYAASSMDFNMLRSAAFTAPSSFRSAGLLAGSSSACSRYC